MACSSCGNSNPDANRFCGNCGASLDPALQRMREELTRQISDQLNVATAGWKDQKALDVETTEAIITRVQSWAKLFGFFVAIPLVLVAVWLGLLGYKSYTDFQGSIARAQAEIDPKLKASEQSVTALQKRAGDLSVIEEKLSREQDDVDPKLKKAEESVEVLQGRAGDLSKTLDAVGQLAPKFESLSNRVDTLQAEIVKFQSASELTPDRQQSIQEELKSFRSYLVGLGLSAPAVIPTVKVATDVYYPEGSFQLISNIITIPPNRLEDPRSYLWAYAEAALYESRIRTAGERPEIRYYFRVYYVDSFLGKESHEHAQVRSKYDWVPVFWMIRQAIGKDRADRLLAAAYKGVGENGNSDIDQYLLDLLVRTANSFEGGANSNVIKTLLAGNLPQWSE